MLFVKNTYEEGKAVYLASGNMIFPLQFFKELN